MIAELGGANAWIAGLGWDTVLAAVVVGLLIGTTGVGGVLLAPWLALAGGMSVQQAMALSMIAFMGPGLLALWRTLHRIRVEGRSDHVVEGAGRLILAALPGALVGAALLRWLPNRWALWILAGVVFATSVRLCRDALGESPRPTPRGSDIAPSQQRAVCVGWPSGFAVGLFSALTVTGGPLLLIPLMLWRGARLQQGISMGQMILVPIAVGATLSNLSSGPLPWLAGVVMALLMAPSTGLGLWLAPRIPRKTQALLVAAMMLIASFGSAWKAMN